MFKIQTYTTNSCLKIFNRTRFVWSNESVVSILSWRYQTYCHRAIRKSSAIRFIRLKSEEMPFINFVWILAAANYQNETDFRDSISRALKIIEKHCVWSPLVFAMFNDPRPPPIGQLISTQTRFGLRSLCYCLSFFFFFFFQKKKMFCGVNFTKILVQYNMYIYGGGK